jgi:hypothetical protein
MFAGVVEKANSKGRMRVEDRAGFLLVGMAGVKIR